MIIKHIKIGNNKLSCVLVKNSIRAAKNEIKKHNLKFPKESPNKNKKKKSITTKNKKLEIKKQIIPKKLFLLIYL